MNCKVCGKPPMTPRHHYCKRCYRWCSVRKEIRARVRTLKKNLDRELDLFRCEYTGIVLNETDNKDPAFLCFDHRIPRKRNDIAVSSSFANIMKSDLTWKEFPAAVIMLAHHFKNKFSAQGERPSMNFSADALEAIGKHPWPGNVREMENCIKRAVIMADGAQITAEDLGLQDNLEIEEHPINLRQVREEAEYKAMVKVLAKVDGSVAKAAELLGVSRPTLYDLMNRHGLK